MKNSINYYVEKLKEITNDYQILNPIESKKKGVFFEYEHLSCGNKFIADFSSLKSSILKHNGGCPKCAMEKRKNNLHKKISIEDFENYLKETKEDQEYTVKKVWYDSEEKRSWALLHHNTCNRDFKKRINDFKNGYKCTHCALERKDSSLTIKIKEYLKNHDLDYETETSIRDIPRMGNNYLLNDFNLGKIFIESDGEQHFMQKAHRDLLETIRERDICKDDYYYNNKSEFTYLRIPFTEEKNIEEILDIFFSKRYSDLRKFRVMIISEKTIINYENQIYYEINKTRRQNCRSKTV